MSLHIITGCMFSGKTTKLIEYATKYRNDGKKVLIINSKIDTRCGNAIQTHNKIDMEASKLSELKEYMCYFYKYDVICIDEAQFFKDLESMVRYMVFDLNKRVIVAGLNADFNQRTFGQISSLLCICENIEFCHATCQVCCKPAHISKRVSVNKKTIEVNDESYIPVCGEHV